MPKGKPKQVSSSPASHFFILISSQASADPYEQALKLRDEKLKVKEAKRQQYAVFESIRPLISIEGARRPHASPPPGPQRRGR